MSARAKVKKVTQREGAGPQFLLLVAMVFVAAGAALWLTGEVGAFVHSGHWPRITAGDMGTVVFKLGRHPARPLDAWPPAIRKDLPGTVGFYAIFLIVLFACAVLLVYLNTLITAVTNRVGSVKPLPSTPRANRPAAAAWAPAQLFRDLFVREPLPGRVTLGRIQGRPIAAAPLQSVIAVGPTQSQKSTGLVIPAILEWEGPVLAATVKPDVIRSTITRRWAQGQVFLYDPTGATGQEPSSWSPLSRCDSWEGAYRTAQLLLGTGALGPSGPDDHAVQDGSVTLLAALLLAASTGGRGMSEVVRWVQRQDRGEATANLTSFGEPAGQEAMQWVAALGEQRRNQLYAAILPSIAAYNDPALKERPPAGQFTAESLLDGGANTVYVCAPAHEQRRLGPLFVTLVQQVVDLALERSKELQTLSPPLLVVLDDAAMSAPLPQLDVLAATAASRGIQLVTTFRHLTQVQSRYGERAEAVFVNHRAKIVMSGVADQATLTLLSHLLSDESLRAATPADAGGGRGAGAPTPAEMLRRIWPGHGILLYGHLPPAYLTLRPWFRDRLLSAMVAGTDVRPQQRGRSRATR